jgi:hypothetical protein
MPNYCTNKLIISGDMVELERFVSVLKPDDTLWDDPYFTSIKERRASLERIDRLYDYLCLHGIMPCKEEVSSKYDDGYHIEDTTVALLSSTVPVPPDVIRRGFSEAGYHWVIANWGTKWDVDVSLDDIWKDDGTVVLDFVSAWSPPLEWLIKTSSLYPDLEFDILYHETGCCFAGDIKIINGVEEQCDTYNTPGEIEGFAITRLGYTLYGDYNDSEYNALFIPIMEDRVCIDNNKFCFTKQIDHCVFDKGTCYSSGKLTGCPYSSKIPVEVSAKNIIRRSRRDNG